jgi:hypothetical protein
MNMLRFMVFVISASLGFICLFHAARVQSVMLRICSKDEATIFQIAKIIVESPLYMKALRFGGIVVWIIAAGSYIALMKRWR